MCTSSLIIVITAARCVADIPQQTVGSISPELDAYLLVDNWSTIIRRQTIKLVLHPRVSVEHEAFAVAGLESGQHGGLTTSLACCREIPGVRLVGHVGHGTGSGLVDGLIYRPATTHCCSSTTSTTTSAWTTS